MPEPEPEPEPEPDAGVVYLPGVGVMVGIVPRDETPSRGETIANFGGPPADLMTGHGNSQSVAVEDLDDVAGRVLSVI